MKNTSNPIRHGRGPRFLTIDRYLLGEMARPLGLSLLVVLTALILERLLRLFQLLALHGGGVELVFGMVANLIPHYLGLALPAAFTISVLIVVVRLGEESEMDALETAGISVQRVGRIFVLVGVILALLSIGLFGYLQPYSRYAYRAVKHLMLSAPWDAQVIPGTFINAGDGMTISARNVDLTGHRMAHVLVHQIDEKKGGTETVTTAEGGEIRVDKPAGLLQLVLSNGVTIQTKPDGQTSSVTFDTLVLGRTFSLEAPPFRIRGNNEREMTLGELWREAASPEPRRPPNKLLSEFHARLVRAVSLVFLPLFAVPMGLSAKRSQRWQSIALAAVVLVIYNQLIQLMEGFGDLGTINPALGLWGLAITFGALCIWLYTSSKGQGSGLPFERIYDAMGSVAAWVGRQLKRLRWRKTS